MKYCGKCYFDPLTSISKWGYCKVCEYKRKKKEDEE